jgi:hypothetical protein
VASAGAAATTSIPTGEYYERGFPVLSAGPTPRTPLEEWTFSIPGAVDEAPSWTWDEFTALAGGGCDRRRRRPCARTRRRDVAIVTLAAAVRLLHL